MANVMKCSGQFPPPWGRAREGDAPTGASRCLLALALALPLLAAACGKKGDLEPPPGATLYKQGYPAGETVLPPPDEEDGG